MSNKPDVDMDIVRVLGKHFKDDLDGFIFDLSHRASNLQESGDFHPTVIAFEMFESAFSAFENERTHDEIKEAYPEPAWREDTVEVPREWLREIVDGWKKYKAGPDGATFGEAFQIEGGGQGKRPVRNQLNQYNKEIGLSNAAWVEYHIERLNGGPGSWERACGIVADREGLSIETVTRASVARRKRTTEGFDRINALKRPSHL